MTAPEAQDKVLIDLDFCVGLTQLLRGGANTDCEELSRVHQDEAGTFAMRDICPPH